MKKYLFSLFLLFGAFTGNAQNVGIGTTTPVARLHVADSAVLFTNNATSFGLFTPPTSTRQRHPHDVVSAKSCFPGRCHR